MEYAFHVYNKLAADGAAMAVDKLLRADMERKLTPRRYSETPSDKRRNAEFQKRFDGNLEKPPVIVCIGSDLAIGDSLGPLVGSMLKYKTQGMHVFIYGTLAAPVTAKEIKYLRTFLKETHAGSQIVAVDAAVGAEGDIGLIKLTDSPLYPGAGAQKKLGAIGDISVMGIVAEKSVANYGLLNTTRLNLVYSMSEMLSDAIANVLWNRASAKRETFAGV
ncbi:MAG: spore protease YyaC [Clostridia bacterium]|nr:spore protease YyaC [Clostridiales bacterium]MBQ3505203.1 spore protease YyaC [Clostridia bacterium]